MGSGGEMVAGATCADRDEVAAQNLRVGGSGDPLAE